MARVAAKLPRAESRLESQLALQMRGLGLNGFVREFKFVPNRRWRFDFAFWSQRLAIECEGGTWSGGRHTTGTGFAADCEKYNHATLLGWRVLRFTAEMIHSGEAVRMIEEALEP